MVIASPIINFAWREKQDTLGIKNNAMALGVTLEMIQSNALILGVRKQAQ